MDRILFGDNQFFAINHISEEKSRTLSIKFKDDSAIIQTLDIAGEAGLNTFMCTTYERISVICDHVRQHPDQYQDFKIYPCMPYAHKYANAVTELGYWETIKQYVPGNFFSTLAKGGIAFLSKDFVSIVQLLIDAEMKMFKGINTPVIWLQNIVTDLLLGLGMKDMLIAFHDHIKKKYNAEVGYITMNMPKLIEMLDSCNIENPIICTSINKIGFRMSGGREKYEEILRTRKIRVVAMQVLAAGAIPPAEALEYVCSLPNIESILFGASSKAHIFDTVAKIKQYDGIYRNQP